MRNIWQLKRMVILLGSLGAGLMMGLFLLLHNSAGNAVNAAAPQVVTSPLKLVYRFNGVTDDGKKGQADRKQATSVHCTNFDAATAQIQILLYQFNGTTVYTATFSLAPNSSKTTSTQNTTIYYEDKTIDTGVIDQGSGQIFSSTPDIICTAQALDPLNNPPVFAVRLKMFHPDGTPVGGRWGTYLPVVIRP